MSETLSPEQLRHLGNELHQRLLDGDPTAPARIAETFLPLTISLLTKRFSSLSDPHLVGTAVEDALLNYFTRPEQYDPSRSSLVSYLRMAANGDLLNLLKQSQKESARLVSTYSVELSDQGEEHEVELPDDFDLESWVFNQNSPVWDWLPRFIPDPVDQEIVLLMLNGVRETEIYADVLGLSSLSLADQAKEVKRHKDRLKKKFQRNIDRSELSEHD